MFITLETQTTEFYDCNFRLSSTRLDAQQLKEFVGAQMPNTGFGEVPWSTPISSNRLVELAETGKAEFVTARMMLAADGEAPILGIGALVRDSDNYPNPRMIIVVDSGSRCQGIGSRIAKELLARLNAGETVQAEVQIEALDERKTAGFFEGLGFECIEKNHRTGLVPEYMNGELKGSVARKFALYSFTK